jgi:glycyl-tRNA synthetase alpha subunit
LSSINAYHLEEVDQNSEEYNVRMENQETLCSIFTKITYEFAHELESLGLWKWSIFVALHLPDSTESLRLSSIFKKIDHSKISVIHTNKVRYIKDMLLKHIEDENGIAF